MLGLVFDLRRVAVYPIPRKGRNEKGVKKCVNKTVRVGTRCNRERGLTPGKNTTGGWRISLLMPFLNKETAPGRSKKPGIQPQGITTGREERGGGGGGDTVCGSALARGDKKRSRREKEDHSAFMNGLALSGIKRAQRRGSGQVTP